MHLVLQMCDTTDLFSMCYRVQCPVSVILSSLPKFFTYIIQLITLYIAEGEATGLSKIKQPKVLCFSLSRCLPCSTTKQPNGSKLFTCLQYLWKHLFYHTFIPAKTFHQILNISINKYILEKINIFWKSNPIRTQSDLFKFIFT